MIETRYRVTYKTGSRFTEDHRSDVTLALSERPIGDIPEIISDHSGIPLTDLVIVNIDLVGLRVDGVTK